MSEKFVVGQWVTRNGIEYQVELIRGGKQSVKLSNRGWTHIDECQPFAWQVGKTYKTTLDGVTATVDTMLGNNLIAVDCDWYHVADPIHARTFKVGTGRLAEFEDRTDVPHLLPYLADEPQPVAEAATFSEFAEADECDDVNHPTHYTSHPSGVECITITEAFNFNIGNAIKYLWRAGLKGDALEDLRKATWYVQREIERAKR